MAYKKYHTLEECHFGPLWEEESTLQGGLSMKWRNIAHFWAVNSVLQRVIITINVSNKWNRELLYRPPWWWQLIPCSWDRLPFRWKPGQQWSSPWKFSVAQSSIWVESGNIMHVPWEIWYTLFALLCYLHLDREHRLWHIGKALWSLPIDTQQNRT